MFLLFLTRLRLICLYWCRFFAFLFLIFRKALFLDTLQLKLFGDTREMFEFEDFSRNVGVYGYQFSAWRFQLFQSFSEFHSLHLFLFSGSLFYQRFQPKEKWIQWMKTTLHLNYAHCKILPKCACKVIHTNSFTVSFRNLFSYFIKNKSSQYNLVFICSQNIPEELTPQVRVRKNKVVAQIRFKCR